MCIDKHVAVIIGSLCKIQVIDIIWDSSLLNIISATQFLHSLKFMIIEKYDQGSELLLLQISQFDRHAFIISAFETTSFKAWSLTLLAACRRFAMARNFDSTSGKK